jgi:hypothetical protein
MVDRSGREPLVSHGQGVQSLSHLAAHNSGGGRGYRTLLDKMLARQLRSPLLPPYNWYPRLDSNLQPYDFESDRTTN